MAGKATPSPGKLADSMKFPVDHKTMQSLYDSLKSAHTNLKGEIKTLFTRCKYHGDLTIVKSIVLDYPPLPILNELFDEVIESPGPKGSKASGKLLTPDSTSKSKKRASEPKVTAATKSLKFSPHLMKREPQTGSASSPKSAMEMVGTDGSDDGDDIILIDSM